MPLKKNNRKTEQRRKSNEEQQIKRISLYLKKLLSVVWGRS